MNVTGTLVFFSIFLLFCGIIYYLAFYYLKIKHLIQNTPTSKIRSVAIGFSEIYGKVIPFDEESILKSPFSYNDCVYYRYIIQEYRSGKNSHWVTIKHGKNHRLFYLEDETGRILVDPTKASIDISRKKEFDSSLGKDPTEHIKSFLKSENLQFEGSIFGINKKMRYIESFIKPADTLYIMGTVEDNPYVQDASVIDGVDDLIITKGKNIKFYQISDRIEKRIIGKYTLISWGLFIWGTIITVLILIAIFKTVM